MVDQIGLNEEEAGLHDECLAKLARTTTAKSRVEIMRDGEEYSVAAIATLSGRGLAPGQQPKEREILRFKRATALEALTLLRDNLA